LRYGCRAGSFTDPLPPSSVARRTLRSTPRCTRQPRFARPQTRARPSSTTSATSPPTYTFSLFSWFTDRRPRPKQGTEYKKDFTDVKPTTLTERAALAEAARCLKVPFFFFFLFLALNPCCCRSVLMPRARRAARRSWTSRPLSRALPPRYCPF